MPTLFRRILPTFCLGAALVALAVQAQPPLSAPVAAAPQAIASRRVVPLEGQTNFRDLGGYRTADGRRVKWGKIYRSGELSRLTDADRSAMAEYLVSLPPLPGKAPQKP